MSSEQSPTVVPSGIQNPVNLARAELKAALAAIEIKANYPKRIRQGVDRATVKARKIAEQKPGIVLTGLIVGASAIGTAVWGLARIASR